MKAKRRKRRKATGMVPVSFSYIERLIMKVNGQRYGYSIKKGLTGEEQRLRNKALIVLLYYSARRISEIVGRILKLNDGSYDVWEGVRVKDFRFDRMTNRDVTIMNVRILKKGKAKRESIREDRRDVVMCLDWPRMEYFISWYEHQKGYGEDTKLFDINRHRAYQILTALDKNVWNHWLRHQRLSHMAETLSPFELNERLGFWSRLDPAISYVHGRVKKYLEAGDRVVT